MAMASITTVALSLAVVGGVVLLALGSNNAVQTQLSKFEIAVWLNSQVTAKDRIDLDSEIRAMPHVQEVELQTAQATWDKIKQDWQGKVNLNGVQPGALTDHFRIKLDDPRFTGDTAEAIRKLPQIEEVIEGQDVVDQVVRFADFVKLVGWCAAGLLFLAAAFIVSNTIRLTLYARRQEIKIMQLVGATNWFIRLPFVFEGTALGAIGGGVACLLVFGAAHYLEEVVTKIMPLLAKFSSGTDPVQFYGALVVAGCFVGAAGSMVSIRRFLRA
jgi:cell division transport system permease protein